MLLAEICDKYFKEFSDKNLDNLGKMFSKDIKLKDWEIQASGIDDVLEANRQIFNSVRDIDVRVLRKYEDGNAVVSELEINVNNGEEITLVVDVIEFDDNGNIANIRAYKG